MNAPSMISFIQTSRKYELIDSDRRQIIDVLGRAGRERQERGLPRSTGNFGG